MEEDGSANPGYSLRKTVVAGLVAVFLLGALGLVLSVHRIGAAVRATCREAAGEFGGDCMGALAAYAESEQHTFEERNHAIWALGEIGDRRAVLTLERLLRGELIDGNRIPKVCRTGMSRASEP